METAVGIMVTIMEATTATLALVALPIALVALSIVQSVVQSVVQFIAQSVALFIAQSVALFIALYTQSIALDTKNQKSLLLLREAFFMLRRWAVSSCS